MVTVEWSPLQVRWSNKSCPDEENWGSTPLFEAMDDGAVDLIGKSWTGVLTIKAAHNLRLFVDVAYCQ